MPSGVVAAVSLLHADPPRTESWALYNRNASGCIAAKSQLAKLLSGLTLGGYGGFDAFEGPAPPDRSWVAQLLLRCCFVLFLKVKTAASDFTQQDSRPQMECPHGPKTNSLICI